MNLSFRAGRLHGSRRYARNSLGLLRITGNTKDVSLRLPKWGEVRYFEQGRVARTKKKENLLYLSVGAKL